MLGIWSGAFEGAFDGVRADFSALQERNPGRIGEKPGLTPMVGDSGVFVLLFLVYPQFLQLARQGVPAPAQ
jgi:hypothetical protein